MKVGHPKSWLAKYEGKLAMGDGYYDMTKKPKKIHGRK